MVEGSDPDGWATTGSVVRKGGPQQGVWFWRVSDNRDSDPEGLATTGSLILTGGLQQSVYCNSDWWTRTGSVVLKGVGHNRGLILIDETSTWSLTLKRGHIRESHHDE